mmetsp:Transcript_15726/g.61423  ORF Transcript_15726/g.61423 Transcript_15726/m.61423 type:complete len:434 (+) Transcript_15726:62-1363(+)
MELHAELLLDASLKSNDPFADLLVRELNPQRERLLRSFLDQINNSLSLDDVRRQLVTAGVCIEPVAVEGEKAKDEPLEVDVVISGGGMKGYYVVGAWSVLRHLIKKGVIRVRRWAGASVGACSAMYMCCDVDPMRWAATYYECRAYLIGTGGSVTQSFNEVSHRIMPDNAAELCTGKVFISITHMTLTGPKNVVVSEFGSKEDLVNACMASSTIPFLTTKTMGGVFRGQSVLDGGVTNNLPIFADGQGRPQLVYNLSTVPYTSSLILKLGDTCIESLVLRGALEMHTFVQGRSHPRKSSIRWESGDEREVPESPVRKLARTLSSPIRAFTRAPVTEEEKQKRSRFDLAYRKERNVRSRSDTESAMSRKWYWKWMISAQRGLKATYFTYFLSFCFFMALIPTKLDQRLRNLRALLFRIASLRWLRLRLFKPSLG